MKAIISQKGQVTIPKGCRDKLGLHQGTVLEFEAVDGKLVAVKIPAEDVIEKWRGKGALPGNLDVDDYLRQGRG